MSLKQSPTTPEQAEPETKAYTDRGGSRQPEDGETCDVCGRPGFGNSDPWRIIAYHLGGGETLEQFECPECSEDIGMRSELRRKESFKSLTV